MAYTEIKKRNNNEYYYRVKSVRNGKRISKERKYLGVNLSKLELHKKIILADKVLTYNSTTDYLIETIKQTLQEFGIQKASIFGSFAKNEQTSKSDVDILIEPPKDMGLAFFALQEKLESQIKRKVDVVTYDGLSPHIKEEVLKESRRIL
jgi:uncharacterized protein